jgi:rhodanese-related sulfurtransferase
MAGSVTAATVKDWLREVGEVAVLDVREHGEYGEGHLFHATPLPYSRFEPLVETVVPRRATRIVVYDDGNSGVAERARRRAEALGYANVSVLDGGTAAWASAGNRLYAGVNVPSKTFGELVEHAYHVPALSVEELEERRRRGDKLIIVDGRPFDEYRKFNIPGGICCPNGELAYRIEALAPDPDTMIVVNCAGRTRSIIGAQLLRSFGVENPVVALRNGTQGWRLAGLPLEHGADRAYPAPPEGERLRRLRDKAEAFAARNGLARVETETVRRWLGEADRTTYVLDVRTPEEFAAGHLPLAVHAPGGQLLQALDQWVAVRGARIVLVDDSEVRATVIAHWLTQMGWDAAALRGGRESWSALADLEPRPPRWPALLPDLPVIAPRDLVGQLAGRSRPVLVDLRASGAFRQGHVAGAIWSIRPRAADLAGSLPTGAQVVLVTDDAAAARAYALDLTEHGRAVCGLVSAPPSEWVSSGLLVEASPNEPTDAERIDFLFFVHDRHEGNLESARRYLAWETGLVDSLDADERAAFRIVSSRKQRPSPRPP